jgi:hypothetical protein
MGAGNNNDSLSALFFMTAFAVFVRAGIKAFHAIVTVLAEIPLVQFFLFDLIAAAVRGKGCEMTCCAFNASGFHVIIVTERHRGRIRGGKDDITAPDSKCRAGDCYR